jgi:S-adenosylmethionine hydrolase
VISSFGEILYSPVRIVLPKPEIASMKIKGSVIYIDNFGSLVTNITQSHLNSIGMNKTNVIVRLGMKTIIGMVNTFGEKGPGELICLYSSTGNVIVSVVNGSARQETGSMVGDEILLEMIGESHE